MSLQNDGPVTPISRSYPSSSNEEVEPVKNSAVGPGTGVYGGIDVMSGISANLQQFSEKRLYDASASTVILPPPDPEGQTGPQPYGVAEQRLIRKFYSQKVLEQLEQSKLTQEERKLIYDALMTGKKINDGKLAQIAKSIKEKATEETRQKSHLPANWELNSNQTKDWIPASLESYDSAAQTEIQKFYDQTVQDLSANSQMKPEEITKMATEKTQKKYGLPVQWTPGTKNINLWKPANIGIITPKAVSDEQTQMLFANLVDVTTGIEKASNKVSLELPDSPDKLSQGNYFRILAEAIRELKVILEEMQLQDAGITDKVSKLKFDQIQARLENLEKAKVERAEAEKQKRKEARLSKFFKILGPIISALTMIVGAALSVFGGVGVGIIIAGAVVGTAMTTYTIIDGETGLTQSLMKAFNDALESWFPGEKNVLARAMMKTLMIAAGIAMLALAVGASGSLASKIASDVAREAVKESVKQTALQASILVVMSSNVLPELITSSLIQSGAIDKDDTRAKFIAQMIAMALVMVTMLVAVASASRAAGGAVRPPNNDPLLKRITDQLQEIMDRITKSIKEIPQSFSTSAKDFGTGAKGIGKDFVATFKGPDQLKSGLSATQTSLKFAGISMQMYDSITRGTIALDLKKLLEKLGELEKSEEVTQALIKVLEQLLQSLQSDISSHGDWMVSLQNDYNALLGTSKQTVSNLFQA